MRPGAQIQKSKRGCCPFQHLRTAILEIKFARTTFISPFLQLRRAVMGSRAYQYASKFRGNCALHQSQKIPPTSCSARPSTTSCVFARCDYVSHTLSQCHSVWPKLHSAVVRTRNLVTCLVPKLHLTRLFPPCLVPLASRQTFFSILKSRKHSKVRSGAVHTCSKLKIDVFGHNAAISRPICFFLGSLEREHQDNSKQLKKFEIGTKMAEFRRKLCV